MHEIEPSPQPVSDAPEAPPPELALFQMTFGYAVSQTLYVAAELGIPDQLREGPRSAAELAAACDAHPQALFRLLRALATLGVFAMEEDGRFALSPISQLLVTGPGSLRGVVRHMVEPPTWAAWGELLHTVKTGEVGFDRAHGQPIFDYYEANPRSAAVFHEAMTAFSALLQDALVGATDFSRSSTIVDVGGGNGELLAAILEANPGPRGIVFDRPETIAETRRRLEARGLAERCEAVSGDFFESVPAGADTYLLKLILHDWNDEQAMVILRNIARAAPSGARLVIFDAVLPPNNQPSQATLGDVHMMVLAGGRERTEAEHRELLEAAGLEPTRVERLDDEMGVVEALRR